MSILHLRGWTAALVAWGCCVVVIAVNGNPALPLPVISDPRRLGSTLLMFLPSVLASGLVDRLEVLTLTLLRERAVVVAFLLAYWLLASAAALLCVARLEQTPSELVYMLTACLWLTTMSLPLSRRHGVIGVCASVTISLVWIYVGYPSPQILGFPLILTHRPVSTLPWWPMAVAVMAALGATVLTALIKPRQ